MGFIILEDSTGLKRFYRLIFDVTCSESTSESSSEASDVEFALETEEEVEEYLEELREEFKWDKEWVEPEPPKPKSYDMDERGHITIEFNVKMITNLERIP